MVMDGKQKKPAPPSRRRGGHEQRSGGAPWGARIPQRTGANCWKRRHDHRPRSGNPRTRNHYQKHLHVTAVDVDPKCVHMTYLQLSLLHVPAIVVHGNSLSLEEFGHWYTPP